jgi:hypothetical protein
MAFWGTPREEEWRRRKAREQERESAIRSEGQHQLRYMAASHADEIKEKEGVLDIARGLLSDARYDSQVAHSRTAPVRKETPDEVKSNENDSGDEDYSGRKRRAVKSESGDAKRPRIKKEDDESGNDEGQAMATTTENREKQAEESVREHLLALSYAMFDTLYGTTSFQPKPFCQFLVKNGEMALAEQIAWQQSRNHVKRANAVPYPRRIAASIGRTTNTS